jgi:quinol monooxygenase YgiN
MTIKLGILALLEARAGQGDQLAAFLEAGREIAVAEQGTVTWYAFKISDTSYGILDTFETEDARAAHLGGQIPAALGQVAGDLLAREPEIKLIDVLAVKLAAPPADPQTKEPYPRTHSDGRAAAAGVRSELACASLPAPGGPPRSRSVHTDVSAYRQRLLRGAGSNGGGGRRG